MILARDLDTVRLGAVLKTALDAVVVMRTDGTVAGWNDVAAATFGWSFGEADGRRMSELIIPHRHRAAHERGLAHYLATGEGPVLDVHIEIEALHRAGHELPVELSITRTTEFGEPVFLGFLRDISERREATRRQELLIGELNHRVKNLLGVVAGIAHQSIRASTTLDAFAPAFTGRLEALGHAHEILTDATWERASLATLAHAVLAPFRDDGAGRVRIAGPDVLLVPRQFLSLSMILHELATNAHKYGALSRPGGTVALDWTMDGAELALGWREEGGPEVAAPTRKGFGTRMIAMSVGHELGGAAASDWHPHGLAFTTRFRVD